MVKRSYTSVNGTHGTAIFILTVLMICTSTVQVSSQVQYPYYVPSKERLTRINIEALPSVNYRQYTRERFENPEDLYASPTITDFIVKENPEKDCRSVLRGNYKCLEIENAQIGYKGRVAGNYAYLVDDGYFRTIDPQSKTLQIFYGAEIDRFFVRPSKRYEIIYGPFIGEPLAVLKKAAFPIKERTSFPGTKFTYLSKRWEFPNEKDAMVDRDNGHYDCAHGHMDGRSIEDMRLNSQFFRFRVENRSGQDLFYLYKWNDPEVFHLDKFPSWIGWRRQSPKPFNGTSDWLMDSLNWVILPNNSAVEFDTKAGCDIRQTCAVGVYLNDSRSFSDEVELIAIYPSNKRREFSPKNAPPKTRMPAAW